MPDSTQSTNGTTHHSDDYEKGYLGSVLLDPERVLIEYAVRPDVFFSPANRLIYTAITELSTDGYPVDFISIKERLRIEGNLDEAGGEQYLNELFDFVPTAATAGHYRSQVLAYYRRRRLTSGLDQLSKLSKDEARETPEILSRTQSLFSEVSELDFKGPRRLSVEEMLSFDRDNDPNSVMGKRWLSKGDSLLISGPTGIGKSSFAMQMVVTWCLGRRFFSIPIERPQRALIIQSENNLGDLAITFQDCIKRMGISNDEIGRLKEDLIFLRESSLAGDAFTAELRRWILQFKPDVVLIDPLFSYIGADASKQEVMTHFLRNRLQPIIDETQVILVIIHHTGKPPKDAVNSPNEGFAARSFGSVELINWAREIVTFIPRHWDRRIFSLEFRKRARQAAITDLQGRPAYELFLKHSADGIIWEVCDESDIESVRDNRAGRPSKRESNCDLALRVLAKAEPTGMSSKEWMNACDLPETTFGRTKKDLVNRGIVYLSKTDGTYQLTASALEAAKVGR